MARPRLSPDERLAKRQEQQKRLEEERKTNRVSHNIKSDPIVDHLRNFDQNFNSQTVASSSRADMHHGFHIGNGCRWIRASRSGYN